MFNYFSLKFKNIKKFNLVNTYFISNIKFILFLLVVLVGLYLYFINLSIFCKKSSILIGSFSLFNSLLLFLPEICIIVYILCSFINYLLKNLRLTSEIDLNYINNIIIKFHIIFFISSCLILIRWLFFYDQVLFIFNYSLVIDGLSSFFKIYILFITSLVLNSLFQNIKKKL